MDYVCGRLVEYNLRKVPRTQRENFIDISRKITDENGNVVAGCISEIYCWIIAWIDVLRVDEDHRKSGSGSASQEDRKYCRRGRVFAYPP